MSGVNLCTNPAGGVDLTGWDSDGTITRVTGLSGFPRATGVQVAASFVNSARGTVTAGLDYVLSASVKPVGSDSYPHQYIEWRDAGGSVLSYTDGGDQFTADGTVGRVSVTGTAPASATQASLIVGSVGGVDLYITAVLIEPGTTPSTYADGDSSGWSWDGTAGLSSSTEDSGGAVDFDGSSSAAVWFVGTLSRDRGVSGFSPAAAGLTGDLGRDRGVTGAASGSSGLTADVGRDRGVSGSASAVSGATSDLVLLRALFGAANAASGSTGDLVVATVTQLAGSSSAATAALGFLVRSLELGSKATASSSARGSLSVLSSNIETPVFIRILRPVITPHVRALRPNG